LNKQRSLVHMIKASTNKEGKDAAMKALQIASAGIIKKATDMGFTGETMLKRMQASQGYGQVPGLALRFKVGDRVECRVSQTVWAPGKVITLWYHNPSWQPNQMVPYQIELDTGKQIIAPKDSFEVIRKEGDGSGTAFLRFGVGHRVKCQTKPGTWAVGTVTKSWHTETQWPEGTKVPYQVKLDNGAMIFAPMDDDRCLIDAEKKGKKNNKKKNRK